MDCKRLWLFGCHNPSADEQAFLPLDRQCKSLDVWDGRQVGSPRFPFNPTAAIGGGQVGREEIIMGKTEELSAVRKLFVTVAFVLFACLHVHADDVFKEVTVTEAGTLSSQIADNEKSKITSLKVSGSINGTDILSLRAMAGSDDNGYSTSPDSYKYCCRKAVNRHQFRG